MDPMAEALASAVEAAVSNVMGFPMQQSGVLMSDTNYYENNNFLTNASQDEDTECAQLTEEFRQYGSACRQGKRRRPKNMTEGFSCGTNESIQDCGGRIDHEQADCFSAIMAKRHSFIRVKGEDENKIFSNITSPVLGPKYQNSSCLENNGTNISYFNQQTPTFSGYNPTDNNNDNTKDQELSISKTTDMNNSKVFIGQNNKSSSSSSPFNDGIICNDKYSSISNDDINLRTTSSASFCSNEDLTPTTPAVAVSGVGKVRTSTPPRIHNPNSNGMGNWSSIRSDSESKHSKTISMEKPIVSGEGRTDNVQKVRKESSVPCSSSSSCTSNQNSDGSSTNPQICMSHKSGQDEQQQQQQHQKSNILANVGNSRNNIQNNNISTTNISQGTVSAKQEFDCYLQSPSMMTSDYKNVWYRRNRQHWICGYRDVTGAKREKGFNARLMGFEAAKKAAEDWRRTHHSPHPPSSGANCKKGATPTFYEMCNNPTCPPNHSITTTSLSGGTRLVPQSMMMAHHHHHHQQQQQQQQQAEYLLRNNRANGEGGMHKKNVTNAMALATSNNINSTLSLSFPQQRNLLMTPPFLSDGTTAPLMLTNGSNNPASMSEQQQQSSEEIMGYGPWRLTHLSPTACSHPGLVNEPTNYSSYHQSVLYPGDPNLFSASSNAEESNGTHFMSSGSGSTCLPPQTYDNVTTQQYTQLECSPSPLNNCCTLAPTPEHISGTLDIGPQTGGLVSSRQAGGFENSQASVSFNPNQMETSQTAMTVHCGEQAPNTTFLTSFNQNMSDLTKIPFLNYMGSTAKNDSSLLVPKPELIIPSNSPCVQGGQEYNLNSNNYTSDMIAAAAAGLTKDQSARLFLLKNNKTNDTLQTLDSSTFCGYAKPHSFENTYMNNQFNTGHDRNDNQFNMGTGRGSFPSSQGNTFPSNNNTQNIITQNITHNTITNNFSNHIASPGYCHIVQNVNNQIHSSDTTNLLNGFSYTNSCTKGTACPPSSAPGNHTTPDHQASSTFSVNTFSSQYGETSETPNASSAKSQTRVRNACNINCELFLASNNNCGAGQQSMNQCMGSSAYGSCAPAKTLRKQFFSPNNRNINNINSTSRVAISTPKTAGEAWMHNNGYQFNASSNGQIHDSRVTWDHNGKCNRAINFENFFDSSVGTTDSIVFKTDGCVNDDSIGTTTTGCPNDFYSEESCFIHEDHAGVASVVTTLEDSDTQTFNVGSATNLSEHNVHDDEHCVVNHHNGQEIDDSYDSRLMLLSKNSSNLYEKNIFPTINSNKTGYSFSSSQDFFWPNSSNVVPSPASSAAVNQIQYGLESVMANGVFGGLQAINNNASPLTMDNVTTSADSDSILDWLFP